MHKAVYNKITDHSNDLRFGGWKSNHLSSGDSFRNNGAKDDLVQSVKQFRTGEKITAMQPMINMQPVGREEEIQMQPIEEEEEMLQPKLRMQPEEEEEEFIQPKESSGLPVNLHALSDKLSNRRSGIKLPVSTHHMMRSAFGNDFSSVNIHTGSEAVQMNRQLGARAFTHQNDIYFNQGEYQPYHPEGKRLLAHELTHVIQQTGATPVPQIQRTPSGGLDDRMLDQIARRLRNAMEGWGTDEEAIYSAFSGRTQEQADAISSRYQQLFRRNLLADLRDELTDDEMRHLAIFSPEATSSAGGASGRYDLIANQLHQAMDQWGTDEDSIFSALTGRTPAEITAIKDAYQRLTQRTLEHDLRDEMSGSDLTRALRLLNQGVLNTEDELYLAMRGAGTDEDTLFRVLNGLSGNRAEIIAMERRYRTKYGDLIAHLRDDLNSEEYTRAMAVLQPVLQDVAFEDCNTSAIRSEVRRIIPRGIARVERAIRIISQGWNNMSDAEKQTFSTYFDPANTGEIDESFVQDVLHNFRAIRREFDNDLVVECENDGGMCVQQRLYYTYWSDIHVCSRAFRQETRSTRKERDFVHELAHNAMMAVDRPYYDHDTTTFEARFGNLSPRGNWSTQIPIFGPLMRVILRTDTEYHPDAYSWFAFMI